MDFDSPEVMKNFPGLYASELSKKGGNESDYSDENDKATKKDILQAKRKEKKDKKDKEKGYAALEGESSGDENGTSKSPSKSKKSKSFKFTTSKSKEKREKSREKDSIDVKKDKDKKSEKKLPKLEKEKSKSEKTKKMKHSIDETGDIAEALPLFGVSLESAVGFGCCHDGVDVPLPLRECIDHIESFGITFEGVYKVSGTKSKALHIKKLYNQRQNVILTDYDIPTVCSVIKMFLRELLEPLFTNDLLVR